MEWIDDKKRGGGMSAEDIDEQLEQQDKELKDRCDRNWKKKLEDVKRKEKKHKQGLKKAGVSNEFF